MSWIKKLAHGIAESFLLRRGKQLWKTNQTNWNLHLSKWQKLECGGYLLLHDFSTGKFPPIFDDRAKAYEAEITAGQNLAGATLEEIRDSGLRKPFWYNPMVGPYLSGFNHLITDLRSLGVPNNAKLLEFGSGSGWMAEFLTLTGFDVTGTSISGSEIADARVRIETVRARGLPAKLAFEALPMEEIGLHERFVGRFDAVFVFEALHHAFEWREAVQSAFDALKPGGWFLICAEPNLVHTLSSYRVAVLSNTHEIGFSRRELLESLRTSGFGETRILRNRIGFLVKPHWIAARKPVNAPARAARTTAPAAAQPKAANTETVG